MRSNAITVKLYGANTSAYGGIERVIKQYLERAGVPYQFRLISDLSLLIEHEVTAIPAIQLNDQPIVSIDENRSISTLLRNSIKEVLTRYNYGALPRMLCPVDMTTPSIERLIYGQRIATDHGSVVKAVYAATHDSTEITYLSELEFSDFVNTTDIDWEGNLLSAAMIAPEYHIDSPEGTLHTCIQEDDPYLLLLSLDSITLNVKAHKMPALYLPEDSSYGGFQKVLLISDDPDETADIMNRALYTQDLPQECIEIEMNTGCKKCATCSCIPQAIFDWDTLDQRVDSDPLIDVVCISQRVINKLALPHLERLRVPLLMVK